MMQQKPITILYMCSIRLFVIIICLTLMIFVISIQRIAKFNNKYFATEDLENGARDLKYTEVYKKVERQKDLKYILLWTPSDYVPLNYLGDGQRAFIDKHCDPINCYVTTNRNFFGGDTTKFHAIAFNGRNIGTMIKSQLPSNRSLHQKFIYFNMESADNYPVCSDIFNDFFNWTSTYRLDSDIPFPYIKIRNSQGEVVGPKKKMNWIVDNYNTDEDLELRLQNKSKAVAWFVSHCSSRSGRQEYVKKLQKALLKYGLTVDIYGACGPLKCPRNQRSSCDSILENEYFFYLSFENSFAEDYVTEKLLTALQHETVPIVFGGADYSRFLPPGSYLNARNTTTEELANIIAKLMKSRKNYSQFFKWKSSYTYRDPSETDNVCSVCEALNNVDFFEESKVYDNFRSWWHPSYERRCKK